MKVSLSPDRIFCGWLGFKHQLAKRPVAGLSMSQKEKKRWKNEREKKRPAHVRKRP